MGLKRVSMGLCLDQFTPGCYAFEDSNMFKAKREPRTGSYLMPALPWSHSFSLALRFESADAGWRFSEGLEHVKR